MIASPGLYLSSKITLQQQQEVTFASQMRSILDQSRSAFFAHRLTKAKAAFQKRELRLIAELDGPACVRLSMSRLLDEHYGAADAIKMRVDTSGHMSRWSSDKKATLGPRLVAALCTFMALSSIRYCRVNLSRRLGGLSSPDSRKECKRSWSMLKTCSC